REGPEAHLQVSTAAADHAGTLLLHWRAYGSCQAEVDGDAYLLMPDGRVLDARGLDRELAAVEDRLEEAARTVTAAAPTPHAPDPDFAHLAELVLGDSGGWITALSAAAKGGATPPSPVGESRPTRACAKCHTDLVAGARFCSHCGGQVCAPACPRCGAELPSDARFCHVCGGPASPS
ncbi:MAG: zinc ribbon domain-containing protein, partial [Candidatus Eremiobacterota bacterium]